MRSLIVLLYLKYILNDDGLIIIIIPIIIIIIMIIIIIIIIFTNFGGPLSARGPWNCSNFSPQYCTSGPHDV